MKVKTDAVSGCPLVATSCMTLTAQERHRWSLTCLPWSWRRGGGGVVCVGGCSSYLPAESQHPGGRVSPSEP